MNIRFIRHKYYKWREQFLENISKVFETKVQSKKEERLERENQKLKTMVGERRWNLKKTIGKASPPAKHRYRRIRCPGFADYPAAQSRASILELSQDLGISRICRTIENQQKARLSALAGKRFAR